MSWLAPEKRRLLTLVGSYKMLTFDESDGTVVTWDQPTVPGQDEPEHPARRHYQHEHTKRWSESVGKADAFVFVTPEYNYGPPPSLLNALDYLFWEWQYKAVGLAGYGGISVRQGDRRRQAHQAV